LLARAFFPPLHKILDGVHLFGQGQLTHRIDHDMPKEFKELAYGVNAMAGKLDQIHSDLIKVSIHDKLTGCFNRRHLDEEIIKLFSQSRRTEGPLSLMMLDLDLFKAINDTYGHAAGDIVLRSVTEVISKQLRQYEILYRYGGEEFVILLPAAEEADAALLAERIRASVADKQIDIGGEHPVKITVSIGIASYPQSAASIDELFTMMDQALYAAKENGRNRVNVFSALPSHTSNGVPPFQTSVKPELKDG
jgi:diguanylate cyclase (GGDEF)-like protein